MVPHGSSPGRARRCDRAFEQFMNLGQLPSAPEIMQVILSEMDQENVSVRAVASLIERDRALTAALLRLANSVLFTNTCAVTTVVQALTFLGLRRVRNLVIGLSLWDVFGGWLGKGRRLRPLLWEHAISVAATAKCIAGRTGVSSAEAFAAGLLHDIGKVALGHRLGDEYWDLLELADARHADLVALEHEVLEYDHALVAEWVLQLWHVPATLVAAVADHHQEVADRSSWDLASVVALADRVVETERVEGGAAPPLADALRTLAPTLVDDHEWPRLAAHITETRLAALSTLAA